ncbi:MAG: hypothetical protein K2Q97_12720 [Burkholderiaceae bacterium]|nr:hypothetical protein [Burkholderiaceae bacterium]
MEAVDEGLWGNESECEQFGQLSGCSRRAMTNDAIGQWIFRYPDDKDTCPLTKTQRTNQMNQRKTGTPAPAFCLS